MKGIILAGGTGSRLAPVTQALCKQLLPVYDKPMIYYPLSTLMLAGLTDILIISTPHDTPLIEKLLGHGEKWGLNLSYAVQPEPKGIADAFIVGEEFIGTEDVALILGDNILYGVGLGDKLKDHCATEQPRNTATIFGYHVTNPERYGVIEFDSDKNIKSILEKPNKAPSPYAVIGLYFYPNDVIDKSKNLTPSNRGELEITDINNLYLGQSKLECVKLDRGVAWLDTGTPDSLLEAANFIQVLEKRQGLKVNCPEEIAWRSGKISTEQLHLLAESLMQSSYGQYLMDISHAY